MQAFKSYKDVESFFRSVRTPAKGKPLPGNWRLFKEGRTFIVYLPTWGQRTNGKHERRYDLPFLKITPNNVVTCVLPLEKLLHNSNSIVMVLHKIIPVRCERARTNVYHMGQGITTQTQWGHYYRGLTKEGRTEYFKGIKFNLTTSECLNARPDELKTIKPEQRKTWLSQLKRYKRGLKARIKVGAMDQYIREDNILRTNGMLWGEKTVRMDTFTKHSWRKKLVSCMRREAYPPEVLQAFIVSATIGGDETILTQKHVLENVDNVFTSQSVPLRREYGVFGKTLNVKL